MRFFSLIAVVAIMSALGAPARAGMAEDCEQSGDASRRIKGCTAVIDLGVWQGKGLATAYTNRGLAYRKLGEYSRAILEHSKALRIDPENAEIYRNRGYAYRKQGENDRAVPDYDQSLRIDPDNARTLNNRAVAYYLMGQDAEALDDVDRSLSLRPGNASTIDTRAHVLAAMGRMREALAEFERVMLMGGADWTRDYQEALAGHGYYSGAIDGSYGPNTRAALAACLDAWCRLLE